MAWIKLRDFWTLKTSEVEKYKRNLFECKDSTVESGHSLLVHAEAMHSGSINGNMKFYRPDRMQKATPLWLPKNSYAKPILIQHDEEGDVVGRVRSADYSDLSWKWAKDFPVVKDMAFYNRDSRNKLTVFKSCDWIAENLMPLDDYTGMGYIDLGFQVTNPEAIRKVLNDEYLTVSVGSRTDYAACSICHTDWASDEPCEHKLGKLYDKKRCYLVTGNLKFDELSLVNFPADRAALINSKELKDSLDRIFFLGLSTKQQDSLISAGLKMTDSLYELDLAPVYEDEMTIDLNQHENLDKMLEDLNSAELNRDRANEIRSQLLDWKPESDDLSSRKRSLQSTVTARIRKNKWDEIVAGDSEQSDEIDAVVSEDAKKTTPKGFFVCSACNSPAAKCTCENKDACKCKGCGKTKDACTCSKETEAKDAKKECPKCKKAECICEKESKDKAPETVAEAAPAVTNTDAFKLSDEIEKLGAAYLLKDAEGKTVETSAEATACLGHYDALQKLYTGAEGDTNGLKYRMRALHGAILSHWGTLDDVNWYKRYMAEHVKDSLVIGKDELAEKEDALNDLMVEKDALVQKVETGQQKTNIVLKDSKRSLATTIVIYKALKGIDGFTGLTAAQAEAKIDELSTRHITSLKDTVADLLGDLQWIKATEHQDNKADEPEVKVNDNAQIDESAATQNKDADAAAAQTRLDQDAIRRKLRYMDPQARAIFLADIRFGKAAQ